jgi:ribosomal protein S18 acetylase RimI-like enzyme
MSIERAGPGDEAQLLAMMKDFNAGESITVDAVELRNALGVLLRDERLGCAWLIRDASHTVGYAILTFGYDLEFAGRDAFLTELYLIPEVRGRGLGAVALRAIEAAARGLGVNAVHLMVRPENTPALRLYRGQGYEDPGRLLLTHRLS